MMQPVSISEIKSLADYEIERASLRPRMMALKDRRRVRVGDHLTFLFENRDTVRYQIQEMIRIERTVRLEDIAHEVETYNELIPSENGLCASLLIEYETPEERAVWLQALLGLENHVWMAVGELPPVRARFDTRQISSDRISSVQYVRFDLTPEHVSRFASGARIIVDHPKYRCEQELSPEQIAELAEDFR